VIPQTPAESSLAVKALAPSMERIELPALFARSWPAQTPFTPKRQRALVDLSQRILRDVILRNDPASVVLGYWLRRANIGRLAREFCDRVDRSPEVVHVPTGRVFHVAPANVDTVFLYSWAVAYLCGNANIVRVTGQQSPVLARLLALVAEQMETDDELRAANVFLTYAHDDKISGDISKWCTHRVLWGGDETVSYFRSLPLSPHASERAFSSKYSYAVVSASSYRTASDETVASLAQGFFNDVFTFNQMGCSSPHLVIWIGSEPDFEAVVPRFNATLREEIARRNYRGAASNATHRLRHAFDLACEAEVDFNPSEREFLAITLREPARLRKRICGAGLFTHVRANGLAEVVALVEPHDQTITHFGFSSEELCEFARLAGNGGIDRLVPFGEALSFDVIWDGYDLIGDCLRHVLVRSTHPGAQKHSMRSQPGAHSTIPCGDSRATFVATIE